MQRPTLEVADIFRQYGPAYREAHELPLEQLSVMRAIEICRTATLGGHVEQCVESKLWSFYISGGGSGHKLSGERPNIERGDQFRVLASLFPQERDEIKARGAPCVTPPLR